MGGIILVASIIIWFLSYFPRHTENSNSFEQQIAQTEQAALDDVSKQQQIEKIKRQQAVDHQKNSYIGKIGQFIEPILQPLGFDWRMSVSLLSGMAAKEIVVSTLSVLYTGYADENNENLSERLLTDTDNDGNRIFTPVTAFGFMLFVLIYFPCIATIIAIKNESNSWKWGFFVAGYTCILAWLVTFIFYQVGNLIVSLFN